MKTNRVGQLLIKENCTKSLEQIKSTNFIYFFHTCQNNILTINICIIKTYRKLILIIYALI